MSTVRLIVASLLLLAAAACSGNNSSAYPSPSPAPSPTPAPAPGDPGAQAISIPMFASTFTNGAFVPTVVNASVGDTLTWTNTDNTEHTSTSDQSAWNSGVIPAGGHFSFTAQQAGTFPYHCSIHPNMVGTVVVR